MRVGNGLDNRAFGVLTLRMVYASLRTGLNQSGTAGKRFRRRLPGGPDRSTRQLIHGTGSHTEGPGAARDGIAQGCRVARSVCGSSRSLTTTKEYGMQRKLIALTSAAAAVALMASACSSSKSD